MKLPLKITLVVFLGGVFLIGMPWILAAAHGDPAANNSTESTPQKTEHVVHQAYLGVGVEPVYPGLVKNLPEMFHPGQGVLVAALAADSPAEKAGLRPNDILMSYDNQKLFAPQQLVGLVHSDKAGRQVTLSILRDGKPMQIQVTLGSHNVRYAGPPRENIPEMMMENMPMRMGRLLPHWRMNRRLGPEAKFTEKETGWETFDSMSLQKLGNDQFKIQIQYLNDNGKLEQRKFTGTREEIQKSILAQKDLPPAECEQLLRSLDLPSEESGFPGGVLWIPRTGMRWGFDRSDGIF